MTAEQHGAGPTTLKRTRMTSVDRTVFDTVDDAIEAWGSMPTSDRHHVQSIIQLLIEKFVPAPQAHRRGAQDSASLRRPGGTDSGVPGVPAAARSAFSVRATFAHQATRPLCPCGRAAARRRRHRLQTPVRGMPTSAGQSWFREPERCPSPDQPRRRRHRESPTHLAHRSRRGDQVRVTARRRATSLPRRR